MGDLTRPDYFIGRYGGEEFIFLLRNSDEAGALGYAERIIKEIERYENLLREKFHGLELTARHWRDYLQPAVLKLLLHD